MTTRLSDLPTLDNLADTQGLPLPSTQRGFSTPQHQLPEEARLLISNAQRRGEQLQGFGQKVMKWAQEYNQRCSKYAEALQSSAKEQAETIHRLSNANESSFALLQEGHDRFMREIAGNQSR